MMKIVVVLFFSSEIETISWQSGEVLHIPLHYRVLVILFLSFLFLRTYMFFFSSLVVMGFFLSCHICVMDLSFLSSLLLFMLSQVFSFVVHLWDFSSQGFFLFHFIYIYSCSAVESSTELESLDSPFVDYLTIMQYLILFSFRKFSLSTYL